MERLGSDLQVQVKKLVAALREITKRERQQVVERVNGDCSKVRDNMSQTLSIRHYLATLLTETDPFLLIWVRLGARQTLTTRARHDENIEVIERVTSVRVSTRQVLVVNNDYAMLSDVKWSC